MPDEQTHVIFFAAVPSPRVGEQMAQTWRESGTGEHFRTDTLHATIQLLGKTDAVDKTLVERAGLASSALKTASFELCFDRLMTFGAGAGSRPLVLGTDGRNDCANDLAAELHRSLHEVGLALPKRRKLVPHVTLAYGAGFPVTRLLPEPIRWTIRDIMLIASLHGQGRHVPLGTWPLRET